jgi:cytochrome P450
VYGDTTDLARRRVRLRFSSEGTSISIDLLPHIQMMDPPRHDALLNLVSTAFTPRLIQEMEPRVCTIAGELIDDFADRGHCDLLDEFARHLHSRVIGEMIGAVEYSLWTFSQFAQTDEEISRIEEAATSRLLRRVASRQRISRSGATGAWSAQERT